MLKTLREEMEKVAAHWGESRLNPATIASVIALLEERLTGKLISRVPRAAAGGEVRKASTMDKRQQFLASLIKTYESNIPNRSVGVDLFCRAAEADYADIEQFAAQLTAEGSIAGEPNVQHVYTLTTAGYSRYKRQTDALGEIDCLFGPTTTG